jgi:hypothetical protein
MQINKNKIEGWNTTEIEKQMSSKS